MRVLVVSHGFPPHGVAGVERVAHQTATSLTARGHAVTVLTRRPSAAPPAIALEHEFVDGIEVMRIAGAATTLDQYPGKADSLEGAFIRVLAEASPDVVLFSHLMHHSPGDISIAQAWGIPAVVELHDFFAACPLAHLRRTSGERCDGPDGGAACANFCFADQEATEVRWALRALEFAQAVRDADAVIAPSRFVADYFADLRQDGTPIHVLGNGVALTVPDACGERRAGGMLQLATIGTVVEHKGMHVVIQALRRAQLGPVRYVVFGKTDPRYVARLRDAASLVPGLEFRVFGEFAPSILPSLLAETDLVVVPSIVWESYSIAAREALACGIPVIAARLGALPEAIQDGLNGRLFEPEDPKDLGTVLESLARDRAGIATLAAGIRRSDWISVDERGVALERLLGEVVGRREGSSPAARELRVARRGLESLLRAT
jgi:glycosyltransferase involved in cell wall biosynthesis